MKTLFSKSGNISVLILFSSLVLLISFLIGGVYASLLIFILIIVIMIVTKSVWVSNDSWRFRVRMVSLSVVLVVGTTNRLLDIIIDKFLLKPYQEVLNKRFHLDIKDYPLEEDKIYLYIFVFLSVLIINYFNVERSGKTLSEKINKDKSGDSVEYQKRFKGFLKMLIRDLDSLDQSQNWQDDFYTPLDTKVSVLHSNKVIKSGALIDIVLNSRSESFLVLGEPGSGKSTALKKIYRFLLEESISTDILPVYINLKEWEGNKNWTQEFPPTEIDLISFIRNTLLQKGDIYSKEFINEYYDRLIHSGKIFYILDSFDEIPHVLDVDNDSWIIEHVSKLLDVVVNGSQSSKGIISSRYFRRPTYHYRADMVLEILPFEEEKIIENFKRKFIFDESLVKNIIVDRPDLSVMLKNPFLNSLLIDYLKQFREVLPSNQGEVYKYFILSRLSSYETEFLKANLSIDEVFKLLTQIAWEIFSKSEYGLSIPKIQLINNRIVSEDLIYLFVDLKILRIGNSESKLVGFSHRRFNEYFVSNYYLQNPDAIDLMSIPTDSKSRDTLALYCQNYQNEVVIKVMEFCWGYVNIVNDDNLEIARDILDVSDPKGREIIHVIRFVSEAFINNQEVFKSYRFDYLLNLYNMANPRKKLEFKLLIESLKLFQDFDKENVRNVKINHSREGIIEVEASEVKIVSTLIVWVLWLENNWLTDTLFAQFKYRKEPTDTFIEAYNKNILNLHSLDTIFLSKSVSRNLYFNSNLKEIRFWFTIKYYHSLLYLFVTMLLIVVSFVVNIWIVIPLAFIVLVDALVSVGILSLQREKLFSRLLIRDISFRRKSLRVLISAFFIVLIINSKVYYVNSYVLFALLSISLLPVPTIMWSLKDVSLKDRLKIFSEKMNKMSFKSILNSIKFPSINLFLTSIKRVLIFTLPAFLFPLLLFILPDHLIPALFTTITTLVFVFIIRGWIKSDKSLKDFNLYKRFNFYRGIKSYYSSKKLFKMEILRWINHSDTFDRSDVQEKLGLLNMRHRLKASDILFKKKVNFVGKWNPNIQLGDEVNDILVRIDEWSYGF